MTQIVATCRSNRSRRKASSWARMSRAALLWSVLGWVILQLGLAWAIRRHFPQLREPLYGHRLGLLRQQTKQKPRPLSVVMLGSSRTGHGFHAGTLDQTLTEQCGMPVRVFNFGTVGSGPVSNLLMLKRLLADQVRPDLLLVEVLPPLLGKHVPLLEMREERIPTESLNWQELLLVSRYGDPERRKVKREWAQVAMCPWYAHRFEILGLVMPKLLRLEMRHSHDFREIDSSGWSRTDWDECSAERRQRALLAAEKEYLHGYFQGFQLGGRPCAALEETLQLCQEKGIPVALVLMPEGPAFRSWYGTHWEPIDTYLDNLCRRTNTPLIRARDWMAEENFLDSHHLLPRGARQFTARLGHDAILPLLRKASHRTSPLLAERGKERSID